MQANRWLEEAFAKDGIEVQWHFFRGAGPAVAAFFSTLTPRFAALMSTFILGDAPRAFHALAFAHRQVAHQRARRVARAHSGCVSQGPCDEDAAATTGYGGGAEGGGAGGGGCHAGRSTEIYARDGPGGR